MSVFRCVDIACLKIDFQIFLGSVYGIYNKVCQ